MPRLPDVWGVLAELEAAGLVTLADKGTSLSKSLAWPYGTPLEEVRTFSAKWPMLPLIVLAGLR